MLEQQNNFIQQLLAPEKADALTRELRARFPITNPQPTNKDIPLTLPMKNALCYAAETAQALKDPQLRPQHLLLGLLKIEDCPTIRILQTYGITRERILSHLGVAEPPPRPHSPPLQSGARILLRWWSLFQMPEDGAFVTETRQVTNGYTITLIERTRTKENVLPYSQELHGPNGHHNFEINFKLP